MIALEALDTLALALAAHGHQWNDRERRVYESAVAELISSSRRETGLSASKKSPHLPPSHKRRPQIGPS